MARSLPEGLKQPGPSPQTSWTDIAVTKVISSPSRGPSPDYSNYWWKVWTKATDPWIEKATNSWTSCRNTPSYERENPPIPQAQDLKSHQTSAWKAPPWNVSHPTSTAKSTTLCPVHWRFWFPPESRGSNSWIPPSTPWYDSLIWRSQEAIKRREEVKSRAEFSGQLGICSNRSCGASAEETSSQSCVVPGFNVSRCPSIRTLSHLRAVWFLGIQVSQHLPSKQKGLQHSLFT